MVLARQLQPAGLASRPRRCTAEYRDVLDLRMPEAFDPAGIITAARQIFQDDPTSWPPNATGSSWSWWTTCRKPTPRSSNCSPDIAAGKDALITASPDTVVQGFRGARPDLVAELPRLLGTAAARSCERPLLDRASACPGRGGGLAVGGRADLPQVPAGSPRAGSNSPAGAPAGAAGPDRPPAPARDGRGAPAALPGPRTAVCGPADPRSAAERRPGTRGDRRDRAQRRPAQPAAALPGRPGDPGPDPRRRIRGPGRSRGPAVAGCLCRGPGPCRAQHPSPPCRC